ncbi:MAG: hypothetical protein ACI3W5_08350 [Faecousia sp.]
MANIFRVELANADQRFCELTLPATDYELLDALDKLQMQPGDLPRLEIYQHTGQTEHLQVYLNDCTLYELNAFARKLGGMTQDQRGAFEGILQIALDKREGPMSVKDLFTYANSTDGCHVLGDVRNDEQLGRFYAENDFIPELEDVSDFAFERLNFAKIGKEMREGERGVFTRYGYVLQNGELRPDLADNNAPPRTPEYTLRLLIGRYPFETGGDPEITTSLDLPANVEGLNKALEYVGAASWEEVIFTVEDSACPGFPDDVYGDSFDELNDYAQTVKEIQQAGNLTKLKAVLAAKECSSIVEAMEIMDRLEDFFVEEDKVTPADVAREEIRFSLSDEEADMLLKHVNLYDYGKELMAHYNSQLTDYGLVARRDGQPIQGQTPENTMSMEMR